MRSAAFNTGPDYHLLDHIAPMAALLQCPLFTTEPLNDELARRYYPQVETRYMPDLERHFREIAEQFDVLYECKYWQPHLKMLFQTLYRKEMKLIFCPHGQSDKGYQAPLLAPYALQDAVLVYGSLMLDMLQELGIAVPEYQIVGNYRWEFYQQYRPFYDALAPQIDRSKQTLLYAPTWCDLDNASSYFQQGARVISELPHDWNLILKVHPLLKQRTPAQFESLAALIEERPNVYLLDAFPPVYPILALADIYLGDASSVGYDFLLFEKPMYFFPTAHPGRLHTTGRTLDLAKPLYPQLKRDNPLAEAQRALYLRAYSDSGGKMNRFCKSFKQVTRGRTSIE
ncbi:MAG: CDP-glycerol glycerophosphotransferase family protein [Verrucomicrobia bacterium]|nr:CDP-glycerol glycerophosphotransferase family protein [Verrucomicrobiota bacterium]MBU6446144.1 CDP-glycerol glycerophosphotransferase family protein [Verrucomicrobiota bacterium]MDE3046734.1 CDP-glycerol glycerophosphotransferase family protein [Verrucomicrobiota bacterium]